MRASLTLSNVDFVLSVHVIIAVFGPTPNAEKSDNNDDAMGMNLW